MPAATGFEVYKSQPYKFICKGVDLLHPVDLMPDGLYPILENLRSLYEGTLQPRMTLDAVSVFDVAGSIHTLRRLNDATSSAPSTQWTRFIGAGASVYAGQYQWPSIDAGYSGNPVSLIPYRPENSPVPYMYIFDSARKIKAKLSGTTQALGIVRPPLEPTAKYEAPSYVVVQDFESAAGITQAGTAAAPTAVARFNTTIAQILIDDGAAPSWASIIPTAIDFNYQQGALITINAAQTVIIRDVFAPITNTQVANIIYDVGTTGLCTVVLKDQSTGLQPDAVVKIDTEYVKVISVTDSPIGLPSFRTKCANTHVANDTVTGFGSIRVYIGSAATAGQTLTGNYVKTTITAGTGTLSKTNAVNVASVGGRVITNDDYMHISLLVDLPANIVEGKIYLDVDATTNDFAHNYYYRPFRASDFVPNTTGSQTAISARQTAIQRQIIDTSNLIGEFEAFILDPSGSGQISPSDPGGVGIYVDPNASPVSEQTVAGSLQWTELRFRLGDLVRIGSDQARSLRDVAAIRIELTVTAATELRVDSWWAGGTYNPDIGDVGTPFLYATVYRSSTTGARSIPSPPLRSGKDARRERVLVGVTASADPQIDRIDLLRFGGTVNRWKRIMSLANSTATIADDVSTAGLTNAIEGEFDRYIPFPTSSVSKSGNVIATGTAVAWVAGGNNDQFNVNWIPGTQIIINGIPCEIYSVASATRLYLVQSIGYTGTVNYIVPEPTVQATNLPCVWGPFENSQTLFGVGDPQNPGYFYWTNANDPDSSSDFNYSETTTPSEPLMNGFTMNARNFVLSSDRLFSIFKQGTTYLPQEIPGGKGIAGRWAFAVGPYLWTVDRYAVWQWDGAGWTELSKNISPLFPRNGKTGVATNGYNAIDFTRANALRLFYTGDNLWFSYIDSAGVARGFRYEFATEGWFPESYTPAVTVVYKEEGENVNSVLIGTATGKPCLFSNTGASDLGNPVSCHLRTPSQNMGLPRAQKQWGDIMVDLDAQYTDILVTPLWDFAATAFPVSDLVTTPRGQPIIDLNSGESVFFKNLALDFVWSSFLQRPVLYGWEPSYIVLPENTKLRGTDWIDLGRATFLQGLRIIVDTLGTERTFQVQYDGGLVGATLTANSNGELMIPYSFTPFVCHEIRLIPTDGGEWRLFKVEPIGEPMPELATTWTTQSTTHGFQGYFSHREAWIALMDASTDAQLYVTVDGLLYQYNVPGTPRFSKSRIILPPMKGLSVSYSVRSPNPFRLFVKDCEMHVKEWGDTGPFQARKPFGDVSFERGATI